MAKSNKLSPMMEHYFSIKEQYKDTIIMYRLGDFYEMFFDDALEASKLLDLTLTGRDCGLEERAPMCGVPFHAAEGYISKLVKCGKKVSICEQLSNPEDQKGMVKRDVIRVITPGTVTDDEMLDKSNNNYLCSVAIFGNNAGICWIDISTGELKCMELNSSTINRLEDILLSLIPSEIICNNDAITRMSRFESITQGKLTSPEAFYNYSFYYDNAIKTAIKFYNINNMGAIGLAENPYIVSALGGLLGYIENTQKRTLSNILPPKLSVLNNEMFLDYNTKKNLELLETLADKSKNGSLLGVLDKTKTNMGARCIRRWIQEPLQNPTEINNRLDAVEELTKNKECRESLGILLNNIRDVERLCNKIAFNTINPRECLAIAYSLKQLPAVKNTINCAKSTLICSLNKKLEPLEDVVKLITNAIAEDTPISLKDGGVIKSGYNSELDNYRSAGGSSKKWVANYEAKLKEETAIRSLKIGYNRVFGYYIEVSNSFKKDVPYNFVRKQTLSTGERYVTEELKNMEENILNAEEKSNTLEERLFSAIKDVLSSIIKVLQQNAHTIAELDVLYSFATVAINGNYCKPNISSSIKSICIKDGRHPVVESLKRSNQYVPNDACLDEKSKMLIVTGPNMAGKSTYMRQVALIVLMAHMGCFVPASSADICIVDRVFTRVGASDNVAYGQSTFMVEMTEVSNILNNATTNSLLILDEIGRGTSTIDGLSIAWAIVEYIALKLQSKTLFATHYHELSELETLLPTAKNYHFLIKENTNGITFLYKIARGGASKSFGIEVAALAGVANEVITRAKNIMASLSESHTLSGELNSKITANASANSVPTNQIGFFAEDIKMQQITSILSDIDINVCTPMQALTILADLKKNFALTKKAGKL